MPSGALWRNESVANRDKANVSTRSWYANNKEHAKQRQNERKKRRKEELVASAGGRCVDCSGTFPACVMDFHHKDPAQKDNDISRMLNCSLKRLLGEISKCVLICANCHRIRHAQ